jgi:uroporphyrinogen decarboxylase
MIKNDLFFKSFKGETVERPPVWMMRQAGRIPEFIALRDMISSLVVKLQNWLPKLPCNLFVESHLMPRFYFQISW